MITGKTTKNHGKLREIRGKRKQKKKKRKRTALIMAAMSTYPTSFTLVFECFFGILCCRLDVIHCMFNVVLYAIDHFALRFITLTRKEWQSRKRNGKSSATFSRILKRKKPKSNATQNHFPLPDSRPTSPCPWTCRAVLELSSPTWWCRRVALQYRRVFVSLVASPWWSVNEKKYWNRWWKQSWSFNSRLE